MHDYPDTFGEVLKTSREQAGISVEALAEKVNKSVRYIYRLESGDQKPSYQLLCDLVRELSISADFIFFPDRPADDSELGNLLRMLSKCDERSLEVVKATTKALIETAPKK